LDDVIFKEEDFALWRLLLWEGSPPVNIVMSDRGLMMPFIWRCGSSKFSRVAWHVPLSWLSVVRWQQRWALALLVLTREEAY